MTLIQMCSHLQREEEQAMAKVCRQLLGMLNGLNCTLRGRRHNGQVKFDEAIISGKGKERHGRSHLAELPVNQ